MEQELIQAERLAVIGKLAAGVAHEINNPLGIVRTNADIMRKLSSDPVVLERLDVLRRNVDRAADITGKLLRLAVPREMETHPLDLAELARLRELVQLPVDSGWKAVGARILAGRMGPNAIQDSITINRGYTSGARPGTPIVTNMGLVGRVLRASPHAATVLLITDPGSRIAVFAQQSRSAGILSGQGLEQPLEVGFVERDAPVTAGEILITSGLDGKYPKGIPVATVDSVAPSDSTQFLAVTARPLVDVRRLEEVLLEPSGINRPLRPSEPAPDFVGPPRPPKRER